MECIISSDADSWSCTIEIRLEYDTTDILLGSPKTTQLGPVIKNKADVDLWIRRAQVVALNLPYSDGMSESDTKKLLDGHGGFSKNTILITVKDPEATDLSFVDLPGAFSELV